MFEHLKKLEIGDRTIWMDLPEVAPKASLHLRFAGEANSQYYNAVLRKATNRAKGSRGGGQINAETVEDIRREDRELFGRYILIGWRGIQDEAGAELEYSGTLGIELMQKLPGWIFDRIRGFAQRPENFLPEDEEPIDGAGASELAGN